MHSAVSAVFRCLSVGHKPVLYSKRPLPFCVLVTEVVGDWPSTGGVLNITAAVWTAGFHWWRSGNKNRTHNVSEYMLVLALCLVLVVRRFATSQSYDYD